MLKVIRHITRFDKFGFLYNDLEDIKDNKIDFNSIYPVGSIYLSYNSTNPGNLFGGTWAQIQGRFLLGEVIVVQQQVMEVAEPQVLDQETRVVLVLPLQVTLLLLLIKYLLILMVILIIGENLDKPVMDIEIVIQWRICQLLIVEPLHQLEVEVLTITLWLILIVLVLIRIVYHLIHIQ